MKILILILVLICNFLGWILTLMDDSNSHSGLIGGLIGVCLPFVLGLYITFYKIEPTAIDVYRGKTTLEITYRDSIPIDSVVVFKNKANYDYKGNTNN